MATKSSTSCGLLVIGDEILLGQRQDKHMAHVIARLREEGMRILWARFLPDLFPLLVETLRDTRRVDYPVFVFGGIGATPDDLTRQAAATAWDRALVRHPEAVAEIEAQFGEGAYPNRVRMAELPEHCGLIPNNYNRVPGFYLDQHFFMPGFPQLAWPMLDWVLAERVTGRGAPLFTASVKVYGVGESQLLGVMEDLCARFPALSLFSLPNIDVATKFIDLGFRGVEAEVWEAISALKSELSAAGIGFDAGDA